MKLFNTLTRQKEEFTPIIPGRAGMYCCGPTVYDYAHIGNMRTYLFMDWLRRSLRFAGITPFTVMNITDVGHLTSDADEGDDKLEESARLKKRSPYEIADEITDAFFADIDTLNIMRPEMIPKATDHIAEMVEFVRILVDKGYGYEISDGIYFDISKFQGYGRLSRLNLDEQQTGTRIGINIEKRHPADFALWKKAPREHIMQWHSPWGMGYPGWHIECSAMSRKYLGDVFDIHTGGMDHVPIHHENEIAQSEARLGHPAVNLWMHGEFLLIDGGRMGKSLKNNYLISDLEARGYNPMHYRYFCANAHYRSKLNFTWEAMAAARTSYKRLVNLLQSHKAGLDAAIGALLPDILTEFTEAVEDDLNIPKAMAVLWKLVRLPQRSRSIYDMAMRFDEVLGLKLGGSAETEGIDGAGRIKGSEGPVGSAGSAGFIDSAGSAGLIDSAGSVGSVGSSGSAGSVGPVGPAGPAGLIDSAGSVGSAGSAGSVDTESIDAEVEALINIRQEARNNKDFAEADRIRGVLSEKGILLEDTKQGVRWQRIKSTTDYKE